MHAADTATTTPTSLVLVLDYAFRLPSGSEPSLLACKPRALQEQHQKPGTGVGVEIAPRGSGDPHEPILHVNMQALVPQRYDDSHRDTKSQKSVKRQASF
jgi:hypothetical protein